MNRIVHIGRIEAGTCIERDGNIVITLHGTPVAKPRMTQRDKWKKRPCVVQYRDWCDTLRLVAGCIPPADEIMEVNWVAYFRPTKRRLGIIGTLHRQRPDRDNLDKAILDCLWKEDSGIASGTITKRWDEKPRLVITIVL